MDQMLPAGTWTPDSAPSSLLGTKHTPKDRADAFPHPQTLLTPNISVSSRCHEHGCLQAEDICPLNVYINTRIDFPVVSRYQDLSSLMASY